MYALGRAVRVATAVAVVIVVAGILIHVLGANTSNEIVSAVNDAAKWLVQPFHDLFRLHGAKANVVVNWGLAALVYAIVGAVLSRAFMRSAVVGGARRPWRRNPAI